MSARGIARGEGLLPTLTKANEALLIGNEEENESLLRPFQAMDHGCRLNLTLIGCSGTNYEPRDPSIIVNDSKLLFQRDRRNELANLKKPTFQELEDVVPVVLESPTEHLPDKNSVLNAPRRKNASKHGSNVSVEEWKNCLALALDDVIKKTLQATTHLAANVEDDN